MANILTRLLALPFTLLSLIFTRLLGVRGIPYLRLSSTTSSASSNADARGGGSGSGSSLNGGNDDSDGIHVVDPRASSEYFVRMLRTYAHTGLASQEDAVDTKMWFTEAGYNAALRKARESNLILMVVLTSKEHDDNAAFLGRTLCTRGFKNLLHEHKDSIMLLGGEVCVSRDAHIAGTVLQAATFPFIAFLSVQPMQPSRLTGSVPSTATTGRMSVFSRLEGLQATSLPSLEAHITETLLPRLSPFLNRLKTQKREQEMQRLLREEQDRAYAEAGRKDFERVQAKEAELRAQKEREDKVRAEATAREREAAYRDAWRRLTAAGFDPEPSEGDASVPSVRLVLRLPDGKRLIRRFAFSEQAKRIWHLVECEAHGYSTTEPASVTSALDLPASYQPAMTFSLASTFPRRILSLATVQSKTVGQLVEEGVLDKQVASLIVEGLKASPQTAAAGGSGGNETDEEVLSEED